MSLSKNQIGIIVLVMVLTINIKFVFVLIQPILVQAESVSTPLTLDSRPFSVQCYFSGQIQDIEEVTNLESQILQYQLTLLINEYEENQGLCDDTMSSGVVQGSWYPPTATLPSGALYKPNQPPIEINKMVRGTNIEGYIDSYDLIIEKVSIVNFVTDDTSFEEPSLINRIKAILLRVSSFIKNVFFSKK